LGLLDVELEVVVVRPSLTPSPMGP
jgi:hypothetical protein